MVTLLRRSRIFSFHQWWCSPAAANFCAVGLIAEKYVASLVFYSLDDPACIRHLPVERPESLGVWVLPL